MLEFDAARAVATDGHVLLALNIEATFTDPAHSSVIVDREAAETIAKGGSKFDTITICTHDGRHDAIEMRRSNGMSLTIAPIDGRFPAYDRVMPTDCSRETGQFDVELLARLGKALSLATGAKNEKPYLIHNGTSAGVMGLGSDDSVIGVVMSCRIDAPGGDPVSAFLAENLAKAG